MSVKLISERQLDAAWKLHEEMSDWKLSDQVLSKLASDKAFDEEGCLLKVVAVNSLYSTQLYAVIRMAKHIAGILRDAPTFDDKLVDKIAALPPLRGQRSRFHISFATKFCHFFVSDTYHIVDSAVDIALKCHLDSMWSTSSKKSYADFAAAIKKVTEGNADARSVDRYLWLCGMHNKWNKERSEKQKKEQKGEKFVSRVNGELRRIFESPDPEIKKHVAQLNDCVGSPHSAS